MITRLEEFRMSRTNRWLGARGGAVVAVLVLLASGAAMAQTTRTLTTAVNPPGSGSVSGGGAYPRNTVVNIEAIPNPGWAFSSWSRPVTGSVNPTTVRMNRNKSVTANFVPVAGSVTVDVHPPEVVAVGPQWQLDGGPPQSPGATVTDVAEGTRLVSFTEVDGWAAPLPQSIPVAANAETAVTGVYHPYVEADCAAVGACNRAWETAGPNGWFFQTVETNDGWNALESGAVSEGEYSVVRTTVTGPVNVTFWWKVSVGTVALTVNGAPWASIGGETAWMQETVPLGGGQNEIAWAYTGEGAAYLDTFNVVESDPPTGSLTVNGGAALTGSAVVSLGLTWDDGDGSGVTRMRFSNNGSTWSAWENKAVTKAWAVTPGDGLKTVRAQFRDKAGNVSTAYTASITVDTAPPTGTIVINSDAPTAPNPDALLTMTWDDGAGSGVTRMRFSNDGATWSPWEPVVPDRGWTLIPGSGYRTVRVQFRDRLGNVSDRISDYIRLQPLP
jgi:hypothetical protein